MRNDLGRSPATDESAAAAFVEALDEACSEIFFDFPLPDDGLAMAFILESKVSLTNLSAYAVQESLSSVQRTATIAAVQKE